MDFIKYNILFKAKDLNEVRNFFLDNDIEHKVFLLEDDTDIKNLWIDLNEIDEKDKKNVCDFLEIPHEEAEKVNFIVVGS